MLRIAMKLVKDSAAEVADWLVKEVMTTYGSC